MLWTVARQAPLSLGFPRQEYWSRLPCPLPGDLPNPGIEPRSPTLQANSLPAELPGKPLYNHLHIMISGAPEINVQSKSVTVVSWVSAPRQPYCMSHKLWNIHINIHIRKQEALCRVLRRKRTNRIVYRARKGDLWKGIGSHDDGDRSQTAGWVSKLETQERPHFSSSLSPKAWKQGKPMWSSHLEADRLQT